MGYSYEADDTPLMCFNAPKVNSTCSFICHPCLSRSNALFLLWYEKNYQLGWYVDRQITVTSSMGSWGGDLVGLSDYENAGTNQLVLARVPGDWFVSFNRKAGINSGVVEAADQVLIHRKFFNNGISNLIAKLSDGQSYTYTNYAGSGLDLIITADSIETPSDGPWYASVRICFGADACCEPFGNRCSSSDDCCGDLLCLGKGKNKSCRGCDTDSQCDNGNVCDGLEQCVNNQCVAGTALSNCCEVASDCPDGQQCVGNTCTDSSGCEVASDCPDGQQCVDSTCTDTSSCTVLPLGAGCGNDADCCSQKCKGKAGSKTCKA